MRTLLYSLLILFCLGCKTKTSDCDDGNSSEFDYALSLDETTRTVTIDYWDTDSDDDCLDHSYSIRVAPLNGATQQAEIMASLNFNHLVDVKFEGSSGELTLPGLLETDGLGNMMIYTAILVKHPTDMDVSTFTASDEFDQNYFHHFYFGVYPGGDVPDLSGCSNCNDEECEDGSVATCGCFNGFCFCRLCPDIIVWE